MKVQILPLSLTNLELRVSSLPYLVQFPGNWDQHIEVRESEHLGWTPGIC